VKSFRKGDLIAKINPSVTGPLQTGIVTENRDGYFTVKWTSYNKTFFMEKKGDIFNQLNKLHLLGWERFEYNNPTPFLVLLNSNYIHGYLR
jgi:hypothetical protein